MPDYTLPDGITLKNKLGATRHDELEKLETEPVRLRLVEVELGFGPKGKFDAEHLKAIHRHLFQDVFEWAGHTRDERVVLSDGTVATEPTLRKVSGRPFSDGEAIAAALGGIEATLREANYLRGLPREDFAERAADIMAGLNAIHPFREGNGRTQRVFIEQLAHAAGHELDFTVVSKERMTQASIAAHEENDPSMMRRMFAEISDPARAALLREGIEKLQTAFDRDAQRTGKTPVHWNDHYLATLAPGHSVELVFAGVAGDQFMARSNTQILFGNVSDLPEPRPERGQTFVVTALPRSQQQRCQGQDTASLTPAAPAESPREAAQRERDERIARALQEYAPELNAQHSPGRGGSKR